MATEAGEGKSRYKCQLFYLLNKKTVVYFSSSNNLLAGCFCQEFHPVCYNNNNYRSNTNTNSSRTF